MEYNSELEEGEACCYKDDHNNLDSDTALSSIDEKIQNFLGHFQRVFEGCVSTDELGARYGQHGSFLPMNGCSSPTWSHPTPQINYGSQKPPKSVHMKAHSNNLKAPENASFWGRSGNSSCSVQEAHDTRLPSANAPLHNGSHLVQVVSDSAVKDGSLNKPAVSTEQRSLKFRFKMSQDIKSKKNNVLYSGLGLDNTPSSSLGNSPGETGGLVATSREITSESPTSILQVMTSFFIPGGAIVSPLHDSLLSLLRNEKERPFRNRKDTSFFNSSPNQFVELSSEPPFGVGKLSEKKNTKPMGKSKKSVENKNAGSLVSENENRSLSKKRFENIISGGKEMLSKDLKVDVVDPMEANPRDVDRDGAVEKLFSSDSVKEDSLESISGSGMSRKPNPQRSSVEKCQNNNAEGSSIDVSIDTRENSRGNKSMSLAHVKLRDISKDKAARKNPSCEQDDKNIEFKKEKPSSKGRKKLRSSEGSRKANVSNKEILRPELGAATNGMTDGYVIGHHISTENSRLNKLKSQKDDFTDPSGRHFTKQPKHYSLSASERKEAVPFCNLKEIVGDSKVDNHLSAVSVIDVALMVLPNTEDGFTSEAAAPAVVIDENWVQCDRCQKWRLLPDGTKTEQLPEKWLCSMLNWLPQMNRCDISEDDTTKALHELYLNPSNLSQNSLEDVVNQSATMVNQNNWSLNSEVVAARVKKKYGSKEVLKSGGVNGLTLISGPRKDTPRESVKRRSLNGMAHLPAESDLVNKSGFQQHEQHKVRGSKKIKTEDVFSDEKHEDSNLDLQRASQNIHTAMASGRVKEENEYADSELAMKERLVVSVKNVRVTHNSSGGGSLDVTMRDKKDSCMRKRKLGDLQDNQNGSSGGGSLDLTMRDNKDSSMRKRKLGDSLNNQNGLYVKEKSSGSGFRKEKKALLSKHGMQYPGGDFQNIKSRGDSVGGSAEVKSVDEAHKLNKPKSKLAFQQAYDDGLDSLRRDSGCRQVATTANSSSSKISGSHKARVNFEEVKSSPVESVSSSPMRTLYHEKLTLAGGISLAGDDAADGGIPVTGNFRRCSDGASADLISSGMMRKEKRDGDCNTRSHKISTADLMDGSAEQNDNGKTKSCEIGKSSVFSNDAEIIKEKQCLTNQKAFGHCQDDGRVDIEQREDTSFLHKLGKEHASQLKDNSKSSAGKKIKAYEQPNEQDLNCEKGNLHEKSKATHNKIEKYGGRRDSLGQMSSATRMENQLKLKEHNKPDVKSAAQCYINCKVSPSQSPIQDTGGERKVLHVEAAGNTYKSASEFEVQNKRETQDHHAAVEPPPRLLLKEFPVNASSNGDVLKVSKGPGNAGRKSVARPGKKDVHLVGPDLSSQNPGPYLNRPSSSALKKGKELRELADNLKNSGFSFESNEANFKAALEFLRGASLSETCTGEGGRPGDVSPMQAYSIATKLCETCAQEYEKRKEMAATSLAYKCMEVAYMRVVYCKNPTSSRDRHELQATLMTPQGESPSSSASDVDNLNHQAPVDKGTVTNVAGTHIVARKRPKFIRLLDFMQDVSSAMEASTKSQKAFEAANSTLAEAQNKECITSVRKVIDFSFQDVEGLIRLVQQALEAISHSDLGGGRC